MTLDELEALALWHSHSAETHPAPSLARTWHAHQAVLLNDLALSLGHLSPAPLQLVSAL